MDAKEVFTALPHINVIWVTDDGHFHLHSSYGGQAIHRDSVNEDPKTLKKVIEHKQVHRRTQKHK